MKCRCAEDRIRELAWVVDWRTRVVLCAAVVTGCASVDTTPDYDRAIQEIRAATGAANVYHPDDDDGIPEREAELLAQGLELQEAVELGLLRNPFLQASFRSVGMANADRVQAGLLSNPSLSAALRFPIDGGTTQIEGGLFGSIVDLWQMPARTRIAERALEETMFELAHSAVQLAASIRAAYIEVLAAEQILVIAQENMDSATRLVELVGMRLEVGAATAVDRNLSELERLDAEIVLRDARFREGDQRRTLASLLGYLYVPAGLQLSGALPAAAGALPDLESLQILASERRLDVRAAQSRLQEAVEELQRQRGLIVKEVQGGIEAESEGDWALGPAIRLELPIFDQNQAQIARAVESLARHQALLQAVHVAAAQDVSSALARSHAQWDAVRLYGDQVACAQETLDLSRQSYEVGKITILPVIEAQRKLLSARRMLVLRLSAAAAAVSDLERATGTTREVFLVASDNQEMEQP